MKTSLAIISLVLLSGCNSGSSGGSPQKSNQDAITTQVKDDSKAMYLAVLKPLNESVDVVSGSVAIDIDGDFMVANVRVNGSSPNTIHAQSIHLSHFCPNELADENLDGYIDVKEIEPYTSSVLIPLDGDLNSQSALNDMYPFTDAWGAYIYSVTNSYQNMMDDLYQEDENAFDGIAKLKKGVPLNLTDKVVVIYGVADSYVLPDSVASIEGYSANQTLPIACGAFVRLNTPPGEIENDDITVGTLGQPTGRPTTPGRPTAPGTPGRTQPGSSNPTNPAQCPRDKDCT